MKFERWSLLALMRFVLAFIVSVNHLDAYSSLGWLSIIPKFGAFEAILGFLLISGYSIGSSYSRQPADFLKRRAYRIYPVYVGAIALTFIVPHTVDVCFVLEIVQNLLFLNQLTTTSSYIGPAWSLSLEVWLYCLTPLLWRLKTNQLKWTPMSRQ